MTLPLGLTRLHLEQALTPGQLKATRLVRVAMMLGVFFFYAAVLLVFATRPTDSLDSPDAGFMDLVSGVHAVVVLASAALAFFLAGTPLRKERLLGNAAAQSPEQAAGLAVALYRTSTILLMAPLEGAAFFGAAVCLIGVQNGAMTLYPVYWLNAGSAALMMLVGLMTFPTRERTLQTLASAFIQG